MNTNSPVLQSFGVPADSQDLVDLGAIFRTLWRGRFWILIGAFCCGVAAFYYAFAVAVPTYKARSAVMLETRQSQVLDFGGMIPGMSSNTGTINSEVEVLQSRELLGRVVDRRGLVQDSEFNIRLREPDLRSQATARIKEVLLPLLGEAVIEPDQTAISARVIRDQVITALLKRLQVANVSQTLVYEITVESTDPKKAALLADTIVELYIENQVISKFEATEQATTFLSNRVSELQLRLETAEVAVSEFNTSTDLVSIEALQAQERQLKDLRERISTAQETGRAARAEVARLEAQEDRAAQAAALDDAQLNRFLPQVDTNPGMATAFDTRFQQILARQQLEADRQLAQISALEASASELATSIDLQNQDLIALQQLQREAEAVRLLYETFLRRLQETSAQQGLQQADSRLLSRAVIPANPASPQETSLMLFSAIGGGILVALALLLREMGKNTFRAGTELEQATNIPVVGQVPTFNGGKRRRLLAYLRDNPTSLVTETFRDLRTSVMMSKIDSPPQVIMSTSSLPGEGKTTNSVALAHNMVGMGKKVLLVEGDIRRRTLNSYFSRLPSKGLVSAVSGTVELDEALLSHELGLDILGGEKSAMNAADFFSSPQFADFLTKLRDIYDIIIIDTPPVLLVPDARILASLVDYVMFSVKWDQTKQQEVADAVQLFATAGQKVDGLILSQVNARRMRSYGYGRKYAYGYGARQSGYYDS